MLVQLTVPWLVLEGIVMAQKQQGSAVQKQLRMLTEDAIEAEWVGSGRRY